MRYWFTSDAAPFETTYLKRFDPRHWTIDFPRGAMASLTSEQAPDTLTAHVSFLRAGDLVGVIWQSEDLFSHSAHRRESHLDYSRCKLSFRWKSQEITPLDQVNGPTLTIEGEDPEGAARTWYVRLWNYARGTPDAADISLDFDALDGGFLLPAEAQRVNPRRIRRMFITLSPPGFVGGSTTRFASPVEGKVTLSNMRCDGSGSILKINDAFTPEHRLRVCTAYDDLYHVHPERALDAVEHLGFRKLINHYVGMSHFFALTGEGLIDPDRPLNGPAAEWHRAFATAAAARGYRIIWSLSFELLDQFCPGAWKQRTANGTPALTGYDPPSTLVSPANSAAFAYLSSVLKAFAKIAHEAGLPVEVQIGEPWWWVTASGEICIYDDEAREKLGPDPVTIQDISGPLAPAEKALLDDAGSILAEATALLVRTVRAGYPEAKAYLLTYLPGSMNPVSADLTRANLPLGWSAPAFDVLQLEDYEWVTEGKRAHRRQAVVEASGRLNYQPKDQHYLAGFVSNPHSREQWDEVLMAADDALKRGVAEVFIWALPQILRDSVTFFEGENEVRAFDDVRFPIEIGAEASVAPEFSTSVVTSASGYEFRNVNWTQARLRFDAGPGVRGDAELEQLIAFFRARRGSATAFLFQDPYDHSSCGMTGVPSASDQVLGVGNGTQISFPLLKRYGEGESRRITRPRAGTVRVAVGGVEQVSGWTLENQGNISFVEPPPTGAEISAGFLFDVPVRFGEDRLEINRASFRAGDAPSVPLVEVREA